MLSLKPIGRAVGIPLAVLTALCLSASVTLAQNGAPGAQTTNPETTAEVSEQPVAVKRGIDIVFAIDCSGSMGHAMEAAKKVMGSIIDSVRRQYVDQPVRVGVLRYGDGERQYAVFDLTDDKANIAGYLNGTHIANIGTEYVGAFIKRSVEKFSWSADRNVERRIYMVGNEPANDGPVDFRDAARYAARNGISVSVVYCPLLGEESAMRQARVEQRVRVNNTKSFNARSGEIVMATQNTWLLTAYLGGGECYKVDVEAGKWQVWNPFQVRHLVEVVIPQEAQSAQEAELMFYLRNQQRNKATVRGYRP